MAGCSVASFVTTVSSKPSKLVTVVLKSRSLQADYAPMSYPCIGDSYSALENLATAVARSLPLYCKAKPPSEAAYASASRCVRVSAVALARLANSEAHWAALLNRLT